MSKSAKTQHSMPPISPVQSSKDSKGKASKHIIGSAEKEATEKPVVAEKPLSLQKPSTNAAGRKHLSLDFKTISMD